MLSLRLGLCGAADAGIRSRSNRRRAGSWCQCVFGRRQQWGRRCGRACPGGFRGTSETIAMVGRWFLVEDAFSLLTENEKKFAMKYSWVVHASMDQFWAGPVPPTPLPGARGRRPLHGRAGRPRASSQRSPSGALPAASCRACRGWCRRSPTERGLRLRGSSSGSVLLKTCCSTSAS